MRSFAALFAVALPLFGQEASPLSPPPKFSTRSDLVLVPVIVTDKSGDPVPGLRKEAFRLEENGKLRTLSLFDETHTQKLITRNSESTPYSYSNFIVNDQRLRMTVFVLDMVNTPWVHQTEAKRQLVDFLL